MGYTQYPNDSGNGVATYATFAAFPATAAAGSLAVALDTDTLYVFDDSTNSWLPIGGTAVPLSVGPIDGAAKNARGLTIGSNTVYTQTFDATFPGMVSSAAQVLSGVKTFNSSPILNSLSASAPLRTDGSKVVSVGSISLVSDVTGNLPLSQTSGSISLVNQVVGNLPLSQTSGSISLVNQVSGNLPLAQTSGSISLLNQVVGILPAANTQVLSSLLGSVSLTGQVSGLLPAANTQPLSSLTGSVSLTGQVSGNLPLSQTSGSISLTNQVVGNLPLSQTSGSISLTSQVVNNLPLSQTSGSISLLNQVREYFPSVVIGSITHSQVAGGAAYNLNWPAAQGGASTVPSNNGSGVLTWASIVTNPTTSLTIGSLTINQTAGGSAYTISLPTTQSSGSGILSNDGLGALSWAQNSPPQSYVPVFTGLGTVASATFFYQIENSHIIIWGTAGAGTVNTAAFSISLPTGRTIGSAFISLTNSSASPGMACGTYAGNGNANSAGFFLTCPASANNLIYGGGVFSGATMLSVAQGSGALVSNRIFSVNIRVPVAPT